MYVFIYIYIYIYIHACVCVCSEVTCVVNLCSAFNPTHTPWTHTVRRAAILLQRPGSSWGSVACLAQGHLSRGIEGGREHWLFTPPTYNPCQTWDSNLQPEAVSQYQVRRVRTCVLGSSDFTSSTLEYEGRVDTSPVNLQMEQQRTWCFHVNIFNSRKNNFREHTHITVKQNIISNSVTYFLFNLKY